MKKEKKIKARKPASKIKRQRKKQITKFNRLGGSSRKIPIDLKRQMTVIFEDG